MPILQKQILSAFTLVVAASAAAQSPKPAITGFVVDAQTKQPLVGAVVRVSGASLSAINAENQQIIKQTPNFTPKNVKLGVFILFKTNHIRSENNLIKNRTNEKNNQFIFRKISYLCSK